jgi:DNA-binding NarL/FixJ family response regulator
MTDLTPAAGSAPVRTGATTGGWLDVALASDLSLIAEAVSAALMSRRVRVSILTWPRVPRDDPVHRQLARLDPDAALLIYDVDMSIRMAEAGALIRDWVGPWVVLTGAAPGPAWGGLRAAGADAVRASNTSLDDVEYLLRMLAAGRVAPGAQDLDRYAEHWRRTQRQQAAMQRRLASLTPRERQVLDLLRHDNRVRGIALQLGLSESTVRSQMRSVLRKLDVRSQLAAVAALRALDELGEPRDPDGPIS